MDTGEVGFLDLALGELGLQKLCEMAGARPEDETGGVGVQAVSGPGPCGCVGGEEKMLERVFVEASAWVHGERGGFVDGDQGFIFPEDVDFWIYRRLDGAGQAQRVALATAHDR